MSWPRRFEFTLPWVVSTGPARVCVWAGLGLGLLIGAGSPTRLPALSLVRTAAGCELGTPAQGAPCACSELSGRVRHVFGLAIPLNRARVRDLEVLPGLGPARAQRIVVERDRGGGFQRLDDLGRIPGLGPIRIEALRGHVFLHGPDPACKPGRLDRIEIRSGSSGMGIGSR